MNLLSLSEAARLLSATLHRLTGLRRHSEAARPVKCRLIFAVTLVGIDPMETLA